MGDILCGHTTATLECIKPHSLVLVAQDTTFLSLAKETRKADMGTLAVKKSNEYWLPPGIVFMPQRTNFGLLIITCASSSNSRLAICVT